MATVSIHMPEQSGQSGLSLYLRKTSDGTLLNTGGDSLTESPASSGRFTATVEETWAETLAAAIVQGGLTVRDGWLASGETIVRDAYPSSGGGGGGGEGDATLAKQEEILDSIDAYFSQVLATVDGTADTIVGFPSTLTIGNSYTTDGGNAIHVFIRDENDDPITSVGTHDFTDPDFSCDLIITNSGNAGRVRATVTYVDPGVAESYLKVEIPLSESSRAAAGAATMQCTLKWDGVAKTIATQTVTWVARI